MVEKIDKKLKEKTDLEKIKSDIEADNDKFIADKIKELDEIVSKLPNTQPKKEGNITMRQHLINEKVKIQNNPAEFVAKRLKDLSNSIVRIDLEAVDGS